MLITEFPEKLSNYRVSEMKTSRNLHWDIFIIQYVEKELNLYIYWTKWDISGTKWEISGTKYN